MKSFKDYILEELLSKDERTFNWIIDNADDLKDFLSKEFTCEVLLSSKYRGMMLSPSKESIVLSLDLKENFSEAFGREFLDIFPFKYEVEENGEKLIVISPFDKE